MNSRNTIKTNGKALLEIGGCDALELANEFGTPLYVYDEAYIRTMMRVFKNTINKDYNGNGNVLYASKAFSCLAMYRIAKQEGIGCVAVSSGQLYTALKAGFDAKDIYVHGNNKTYDELVQAVEAGVGGIVIDSYREADILNAIAAERKVKQHVLIRVNPGVEAHTHAFVQTARTDSKFGFSIRDNTALDYTKDVLSLKNLDLKGYHCHIGSQIFEKQSFSLAAENMISFKATVEK